MLFLVRMDLIKSGELLDPKEGVSFIEQIILPTLDICVRWKKEKKIVAGGPVSGSSTITMMMEAESAEELDRLLLTLPLWVVAQVSVTPLLDFESRIAHVRRKAERLRAVLRWPGHTQPTDPL